MANHSFSRRRFLAGTGLLLAGTTLKLHSTTLVDESLDAGDPIIDIHQHTDYTGRPNNQLIAHQRTMSSEEHTSALQSLMRISYAVFCLQKKKPNYTLTTTY